MLVLPEPSTIGQIALMYNLNKFLRTEKNWLAKGLIIDPYVVKLKSSAQSPTSVIYHKMNLYFLYRSMHQLNEACNKLWSTIELYYHVKHNKLLCKKFNTGFLGSSTVPTLHYANMSALLSIISLFGVCSWIEKRQRIRYFNIIRTASAMRLVDRTKWLVDTFGNARTGWHSQTLQTYEGLAKRGIKLPDLNLANAKDLLKDRTRLHYDVLGQTTMDNVFGIDSYFKHLPVVVTSIKAAIDQIHQVLKPIPNACDARFMEITQGIQTLEDLYFRSE